MVVRITTLVENRKGDNLKLQNTHGLSFLIEVNGSKYLFDTGQKDIAVKNALEMGIDLSEVKKVIISHNHYDHGGGLSHIIESFGPMEIIVHKDFFRKKYSLRNGKRKYAGIEDESFYLNTGSKVCKINDHLNYIGENVFIAANFERITPYENLNPHFLVETDSGLIKDNFTDELVLGIETEKGLVIILGCSHPGVVNILKKIINLKQKKIYGVFGGTHLIEGDPDRIKATLNFFKDINVEYPGLNHCTGERAIEVFRQEFKGRFIDLRTGSVIEIS